MRTSVMTAAFLLSALATIKRTSSIDVRLRFYNLNNNKPRPLVMQRRIAGGRGFCYAIYQLRPRARPMCLTMKATHQAIASS